MIAHSTDPTTGSRVSVCIPARNAGTYLAETLESALNQTVPCREVLVCDNASTDRTPEICARFAGRGVRSSRFDVVTGQAGNWNRCVDLAAGEYVVVLHADDALAPEFIERAVGLLEAKPGLAFVHCAVQHMDEKGHPIQTQRLHPDDHVDEGMKLFRRLVAEGCLINPAGVAVRKAALQRVGPFAEQISWGIDWNMWMRLCLVGDVGYLGRPLARYRHHSGSGTASVLASGRLARDEVWAAQDALRAAALPHREHAQLWRESRRGVAHRIWCHAESACRSGERRAALLGLVEIVRVWPRAALEGRFWGLGAGVLFGYPAFQWLRRLCRWGAGVSSAVR